MGEPLRRLFAGMRRMCSFIPPAGRQVSERPIGMNSAQTRGKSRTWWRVWTLHQRGIFFQFRISSTKAGRARQQADLTAGISAALCRCFDCFCAFAGS